MPSRSTSSLALVLAAVLTIGAAIVVGAAYSLILDSISFINIITLAAAPGFGWLVASTSVNVLRTLRVHHDVRAGMAITMLAATLGFYTSWVVHVAFLAGDSAMLEIALHPSELWRVIVAINHAGSWKISGTTPKGTTLWILWLAEAGLIFRFAWTAKADLAVIAVHPYCPQCRNWVAHPTPIASFALGEEELPDVATHVHERDWDYFADFAPAPHEDRAYTFTVEQCPCGMLETLDVEATWVSPEGRNVCRQLAKQLPIGHEDVARIRGLASSRRAAAGESESFAAIPE